MDLQTLQRQQTELEKDVAKNVYRVDALREDVAELKESVADLSDRMEHRFESVEHRFESVDRRFESVERRFEAQDQRLEALNHKMDGHFRWLMGVQVTLVVVMLGALVAAVLN